MISLYPYSQFKKIPCFTKSPSIVNIHNLGPKRNPEFQFKVSTGRTPYNTLALLISGHRNTFVTSQTGSDVTRPGIHISALVISVTNSQKGLYYLVSWRRWADGREISNIHTTGIEKYIYISYRTTNIYIIHIGDNYLKKNISNFVMPRD